MKCKNCKNPETKVLESRESKEGTIVRRRRECPECGHRFTTFERTEEQPLFVLKKGGIREVFDRNKLLRSLFIACQKRAVDPKDLELVVDWVERTGYTQDDREISSSQIGELVLDALRELDKVAYVRFASVYRAFSDPDQFVKELKILSQKQKSNCLPQELLKRKV